MADQKTRLNVFLRQKTPPTAFLRWGRRRVNSEEGRGDTGTSGCKLRGSRAHGVSFSQPSSSTSNRAQSALLHRLSPKRALTTAADCDDLIIIHVEFIWEKTGCDTATNAGELDMSTHREAKQTTKTTTSPRKVRKIVPRDPQTTPRTSVPRQLFVRRRATHPRSGCRCPSRPGLGSGRV